MHIYTRKSILNGNFLNSSTTTKILRNETRKNAEMRKIHTKQTTNNTEMSKTNIERIERDDHEKKYVENALNVLYKAYKEE